MLKLNKKNFNREDLVSNTRDFALKRGFEVIIPRGDIQMDYGRLLSFRCKFYKNSRVRSHRKRTGEVISPKLINCKFHMKFLQRRPNAVWELFDSIDPSHLQHNH